MEFIIMAVITAIASILLIKNNIKALLFMVVISTIQFEVVFGYDLPSLWVKIILFLLSLFFIYQYGIKKTFIKAYLLFLIILFFSLIWGAFSSTYTLIGMYKSSLSFILGLNYISIDFKNNEQKLIARLLARLPVISLIIGLLHISTLFYSHRLGGASGSTNLAFISVNAIIASEYLYATTKDKKYMIISIFTLAIVILTLTRGGIAACILVFLPYIFEFAKKISKSKIFIICLLFFCGIIVLLHSWGKLMSRMFSEGMFNTSGRTVAWAYIISQNDNPLFGQGYGKLITMNLVGKYIDHFNAAHNEYVRYYFETGIIGLLLFICIFLIVFKFVYAHSTITKLQFWGLIMAFSLYSLTDNTISNYIFWIPFCLNLNVLGGSPQSCEHIRFRRVNKCIK